MSPQFSPNDIFSYTCSTVPTAASGPVELHMSKDSFGFYAAYSGEGLLGLMPDQHYVVLVYAQGMKRIVVQREANILDTNIQSWSSWL